MVHGPLPSRKLSVSHLGENKNHRNYHIPPGGKGKIILKYNPAPVEIGSLNLILQKGVRKKKLRWLFGISAIISMDFILIS